MVKITFETTGSLKKTEDFLAFLTKGDSLYKKLDKYGREGAAALSAATPVDSGATANSWGYEVRREAGGMTLTWTNGNVVGGVPVAILLQYGHGTGTGGYVSGRDYINPTLRPLFDRIANDVWKAVTSA